MRIHVPRWTVPSDSASRIALRSGNSAPRFEITKFGSSFADNLVKWFRLSPRRRRGVAPSMFDVNWRATRSAFWKSQAFSLSLYSGAVILILFQHFGPQRKKSDTTVSETTVLSSDIAGYAPKLPSGSRPSAGGGGGGKHSNSPVSKGDPPKFSRFRFQMAPPSLPHNENARLVTTASLLGSPELQFPPLNVDRYGDPLVRLISDSEGPGRGGGMGDGKGSGIGPGDGPGFGSGRDGGWGGDTFRPGNGVGYPVCAYCPDAKYSEEARKAKFQGVVILQVVVTSDGRAANIRVVSGPGLGLEEQAVAAVQTWRFRPALGPNRTPVATQIAIEVQFRLL